MIGSISNNNYYSTSLAKLSQQLFNMIDQNSDGSVTSADLLCLSEETGSLSDSFMNKVDANMDGAVTDLEFTSALSQLIQELKSNSAEDGVAAGVPPPSHDTGEMFNSLDTDADGYLSVEELESGKVPDAEKIFSEIDTDGDGKIIQAESDAFDEKMRANSPQGMTFAPPPPPDSGEMSGLQDKDSDSSSAAALQTEFLNKLIEMIAQNNSYAGSTTQTNSLFA